MNVYLETTSGGLYESAFLCVDGFLVEKFPSFFPFL